MRESALPIQLSFVQATSWAVIQLKATLRGFAVAAFGEGWYPRQSKAKSSVVILQTRV